VVHASPAIADGTLFVGSWDSYFYALDVANGKEKWKFKTGEDHEIYNQVGIQSSAAVADGIVYFGCRDSNLYALDARTGDKSGSTTIKALGHRFPGGKGWKSLFRHVGFRYVSCRRREIRRRDFLAQADLADVRIPCHRRRPALPAFGGRQTHTVDLKTQKPSWEFQTKPRSKTSPLLIARRQAKLFRRLHGKLL